MNKAIQLNLTENEILKAIKLAKAQSFIDNLRHRHPVVAFDSALRGIIGEMAFEKWLNKNNIQAHSKNVMNTNDKIDIDFVFKVGHQLKQLELKTSLLPDKDQTIEMAIQERDIKLIRRANKPIEELDADLHCQIIYKQLRLRKDLWLKQKSKSILQQDEQQIFEELAAHRYLKDCYFVGWIDKVSLIEQIHQKPQHLKSWKYGMREFWCCNLLRDANRPEELIEYLQTNA